MGDWKRPLSPDEQATVAAARAACAVRYEGVVVPHRSCGIALAETFGLPTQPYQALRRGGLTGHGECGTAVAGRLILGELLGDPDPGGAATPALRAAAAEYHARWAERTATGTDNRCNTLVAPFPDFKGPTRARFCTDLAAETAALVAEVLLRNDHPVCVTPVVPSASGDRDLAPT
jgi:hypothetical protein